MAQRVFIRTYGCQMNERDSEALKVLLKQDGHTLVESEAEADVIFLNTCSVREMAEIKVLGKAGKLLRKKKQNPNFKLGILGCMAKNRGEILFKQLPGLDLIAGPKEINKVPVLLKRALQTDSPLPTSPESTTDSFSFACYEKISDSIKASAFVPIQQGCDMHCSYCVVPNTRGRQENRPSNSILTEVRSLAQQGTKEIVLLGQIVNSYAHPDIPRTKEKSSFVRLLEAIQAEKGVHRIRFLSPHPSFFRNDLIKAFKDLPKLCPSIHLPIQSGSNKILKAMRRGYNREKIFSLVDQLKEAIPSLSLSTDIIVGFPSETDQDFQATYTLFERIGFDMAFIFKYSPRALTPAGIEHENNFSSVISENIKEERNQQLLKLLKHYSKAFNEKCVGTQQEILLEGRAHRGVNKLFGKTPHNKKVIIEGPISWIGKLVSVTITHAGSSTLEGTVIPTTTHPPLCPCNTGKNF